LEVLLGGIILKRIFLAMLVAGLFFLSADASAAGSDTTAPDSRIEEAISWAIEIANDDLHGYSQGAGIDRYTDSREGPDYDCSSFVYHALQNAGFDIIGQWRKNPECYSRYNGEQYSGDADTIWTDLQSLGGWTKYSWREVKNNLQRGDILCTPKKHVAFYIGRGKTVEARGVHNPRGRGSYTTGDQGGEIDIYNAQGRGWIEVYRYTGN